MAIIQSVSRALAILESLATQDQGFKLSELAGALELEVSTCHNLLKTLVTRGYVIRDGVTRNYKIAGKFGQPTSLGIHDLNLLEDIACIARDYSRTPGFNTYIALPELHLVRYANSFVDGHNDPRNTAFYSESIGIHSASAILFLAHIRVMRCHADLRGLLSTPAVQARLASAEAKGYALDLGYSVADVHGVASPVGSTEKLSQL
ncbi:hypothetical protein CBI36_11295 [Acetobacter oryzifermentans]|uniref:HTH iclR-type domain-containing protein n=1 Tax=Acetobacter oryzifermentans TaxID=1633874 RepID=A0ABC8CF15_9PROT|nr:hypothetical protein CBI36_11295 [Acetobacter oryzifermentans]